MQLSIRAIETGNFLQPYCAFLFRAGLLIMILRCLFIAARGTDRYSDVYNDNFRFKILYSFKSTILEGPFVIFKSTELDLGVVVDVHGIPA